MSVPSPLPQSSLPKSKGSSNPPAYKDPNNNNPTYCAWCRFVVDHSDEVEFIETYVDCFDYQFFNASSGYTQLKTEHDGFRLLHKACGLSLQKWCKTGRTNGLFHLILSLQHRSKGRPGGGETYGDFHVKQIEEFKQRVNFPPRLMALSRYWHPLLILAVWRNDVRQLHSLKTLTIEVKAPNSSDAQSDFKAELEPPSESEFKYSWNPNWNFDIKLPDAPHEIDCRSYCNWVPKLPRISNKAINQDFAGGAYQLKVWLTMASNPQYCRNSVADGTDVDPIICDPRICIDHENCRQFRFRWAVQRSYWRTKLPNFSVPDSEIALFSVRQSLINNAGRGLFYVSRKDGSTAPLQKGFFIGVYTGLLIPSSHRTTDYISSPYLAALLGPVSVDALLGNFGLCNEMGLINSRCRKKGDNCQLAVTLCDGKPYTTVYVYRTISAGQELYLSYLHKTGLCKADCCVKAQSPNTGKTKRK
jgi:hypothetical protein